MSLHLRCLVQLHPGLTDHPLRVLQLSLELAVLSGHLLKQLTHTQRMTERAQQKHGVTFILSADLLEVFRVRSSCLGALVTRRVQPEWTDRAEVRRTTDTTKTKVNASRLKPRLYLELVRWSFCGQKRTSCLCHLCTQVSK